MLSQRLDRKFYSDRIAMERLGLSRSAFYRYLHKKVISVPIGKLGKTRRGWTDQDIELARAELLAAKEELN